jgi:hypothetical protein
MQGDWAEVEVPVEQTNARLSAALQALLTNKYLFYRA